MFFETKDSRKTKRLWRKRPCAGLDEQDCTSFERLGGLGVDWFIVLEEQAGLIVEMDMVYFIGICGLDGEIWGQSCQQTGSLPRQTASAGNKNLPARADLNHRIIDQD